MTDKIVIFLGPTLGHDDARALLPHARFLPPARQGDVYRAVRAHHPKKIGLVDGVFLNVPAVWHREILWALDQGVEVSGAASMGALRAAELDGFGMIGVGKVYEAFRDGRYPPFDDAFEDDDEVAVAHAPAELGSIALSDAMVDIRETLAIAEAEGMLDSGERDRLAAELKRLHFPERSISRLAEVAQTILAPSRAKEFVAWLGAHHLSRKAGDAAELLHRIGRPSEARPPAPFRLERALVWERFVEGEQEAEASADEDAVLAELGLDPQGWREVAYAAIGRLTMADGSLREPAAGDLSQFRRRRGLANKAAIDAWLNENRVDAAEFPRLVASEAASEVGLAQVPSRRLRRAVLDHLRLTGRFAGLFDRAQSKTGAVGDGRAPSPGPLCDGALSWYFEERCGVAMPKSLDDHAASAGFSSTNAFRDAVWREFLYVGGNRQR